MFLVKLAVCGSGNNIAVFIIFRAFMGFAAIAFLIWGVAVIADTIPTERRGLAMSLLTSGPSLVCDLGKLVKQILTH